MSDQLYDQWQEALQRARAAEQQLAQAREENTHLLREIALRAKNISDLLAENAAMRALLEPLTETDPSGYGAESSTRYCPYCGASEDMDDVPVEHTADCAWRKARALRHA